MFTDWRFIDPGWFSWVDAQGQARGIGESWAPDALFFRPVNSPYGIRLIAQPPETVGPLIEPDRPWERLGIWLATIIYENGVYRAWALCWEEWAKPPCLTYFESRDGYTWECPNLGIHEYGGNKDNNILLLDSPGNKAVFVDRAGPAEERYKMVLGDMPGGVRGAVSPDGLHWTLLPEPILEGACDSQNIGYYDEQLRKYVIYRRLWVNDRRAVGRS
ncbi:MAG: hypothetical protein H5T86_04510 [Armatimonadetes bacterium]|nr:hypothetical protein [Armatimonadota bacterium]